MSHGARIESSIIPDHILKCMSPEDRPKGVEGMTKEQLVERGEEKEESEIQDQICSYLRLRDIWFERKAMHKKSTGTTGCPDFLFCANGRFIAMEVKTATGTVKKNQQTALEAIAKNGGRVYVVRSFKQAHEVINDEIKEL